MEIVSQPNVVSRWVEWILAYYASYPWVGLLLLMMVVDILSGVTAAVYERKLSSKIGYRGMMKKASVLLVVGMAAIIELAVQNTLPKGMRGAITIPFAKLTAGFFLFNEALSILENAKRAGVPLPAFLSKSLVETMIKISNVGRTGVVDVAEINVKEGKVEAVIAHKEDPKTISESQTPPCS